MRTCNKVGYDISTPSQRKQYRTEGTKILKNKKGMRREHKHKNQKKVKRKIIQSFWLKNGGKREGGKHKRGQIEHIHHHHAEKSWMSDMQTANTRTQPWAGRSPWCLKKLIGKVIYLHHMVQVFWSVWTHTMRFKKWQIARVHNVIPAPSRVEAKSTFLNYW